MPDRWDRFVDSIGVVLRARQRPERFIVRDNLGEHAGEPGDYIVKGHDGRRRVVRAALFEAQFTLLPPEEGEEEPSDAEVLRLRRASG